jgi:hypothetical protein
MENAKKEGTMSIAERRAAWRGLDRPILPPRVTTARFRSNGGPSPLSSPAAAMRSPCLVIPPGLSPAALLDSPVLLQVTTLFRFFSHDIGAQFCLVTFVCLFLKGV